MLKKFIPPLSTPGLNKTQLAVVELMLKEETLSFPEIARRLGMKECTVRNAFRWATEKYRDAANMQLIKDEAVKSPPNIPYSGRLIRRAL